jgi:lipoprotein NlpD
MTIAFLNPRVPGAGRERALGALALRLAAGVIALALVAGCATRRPAPVEERRVPSLPPAHAPAPLAGAPAAPAPPQAANAANAPAPTYTVRRGDTLYQIALDNGLDYRELAAWNNVENVNRIFVGQVLRLSAPGEAPASGSDTLAAAPGAAADGVTTAPLRSVAPVGEPRPLGAPGSAPGTAPGPLASPAPGAATGTTPSSGPGAASGTSASSSANLKTAPKAIKEPYSEQAVRNLESASAASVAATAEPARVPQRVEGVRAAPPDGDGDDHLDWQWPAKGRVVAGFSDTANLKGIDIAGTPGEPVYASAPGRVVYAGSGLRGYGKLVIIKHNKTYLSAYAHNREILVKEGQQVARGQKIAEMGNSDADQVKLHFEIRRLGKPMDPARYLPPA